MGSVNKFDGFSVSDFVEDLSNKRKAVIYQTEKKKLEDLEKKLDKLMSDDKRTELEIDAIAGMI